MLYTKSEFCKMAGITQETLRHYIDKGLIEPTMVSENGYRKFSNEDILDLWEIRLGVSFGNSLSTLKERSKNNSLENFSEEIIRRKEELYKDLEELQHQIEMLKEIEYYVERELTETDSVTSENSKAVYRCTYDGSITSEKYVGSFVNAFPYTSIAVDYTIDITSGEYIGGSELSLYVMESRKSKLNVENFEELEYLPEMRSVCMTIVTKTPLLLKYNDFEPLFLELESKKLKPKSNIICSVYCRQNNEITKEYLLKCRILV